MKYFKVTAYGDTMYYEAKTLLDAKASFTQLCGIVPAAMWIETKKADIPTDEEILTAYRD